MEKQVLENQISKIKCLEGTAQQTMLGFVMQKYFILNNAKAVAELAINFPHIADLIKADNFILSARDAEASCRFARFINTPNLKKHEEIVLQANNSTLSRLFCTIKGADLEKHSKIILDAKNVKDSFEFVTAHPKIDKKAHLAVILEDANPEYLLQTAIRLKGVGCKAIEDKILKLEKPEYCYAYAKNVPGAKIIDHQWLVLYLGTLDDVYTFAKDIEGTNLRFYLNRLCEWFEYRPTKELKDIILKILDLYDEREPEDHKDKQNLKSTAGQDEKQ